MELFREERLNTIESVNWRQEYCPGSHHMQKQEAEQNSRGKERLNSWGQLLNSEFIYFRNEPYFYSFHLNFHKSAAFVFVLTSDYFFKNLG